MAFPTLFRSLDAVARALPFHLNETDKVNRAFRRWRRTDAAQALYVVDLWTYCFVRRYFLVKFSRDPACGGAADLEELIEQVYARVQQHRSTVADTTRYASWVSVVCKNAFLNYLRSLTPTVSIDQENGPQLRAEAPEATLDAGLVYEGLRQALARLPGYLRQIARLRLLEACSYRDIERITGRDLPTIRSYVNRAIVKIRSDPQFLAFLGRS